MKKMFENNLETSSRRVDSDVDFTKNALIIRANVSRVLKIIVISSGVITMLVMGINLTGYLIGNDLLNNLFPSIVSMRANTTICMLIISLVLILKAVSPEKREIKTTGRFLVIIVIAISLLNISEYIFGWNSGTNELLFKDFPANNSVFPGRMAFSTAICFIFLGLSLYFIDIGSRALLFFSQILALSTGLLAILPVIGYVYNAENLMSVAFSNHMSLYSAILLLLLSFGLICLPYATGAVSILTVDGPGGYMARRLLPVAIVIPVIFIWIRILIKTEESRNGAADVIIVSTLFTIILAIFIWRVAKTINSIHNISLEAKRALKESEIAFYTAFHASPAALLISNISTGMVMDVNEAYCQMTRFSADQLLGNTTKNLNLWKDPSQRDQIISMIRSKGSVQNIELSLRDGTGMIRTSLASFGTIDYYGEKCLISSAIDVTEWKTTQEKLRQNEMVYHNTLENMMEGCQIIGFDWRYIFINKTAEKHGRCKASELIGKHFLESWPELVHSNLFNKLNECMEQRVYTTMVNEFRYPDGSSGWFDLRIQPVPEGIFILSSDISDQVTEEKNNQLAAEILEHINCYSDTGIMIGRIIESIKERTGYEAIAIRVKEGDDYPYLKTTGFSEEFVSMERHLCSRDKDGKIIFDENNRPVLECMCGNIIYGRVDSSKAFFTRDGSFISNNTSSLLATTSETDRMTRTRNRCNSAGYESVALVPIRSGNKIIGLIQLNDHRPNVFDDKIIPFLERMGSSIGIAIIRNQAESELKELNRKLEYRVAERTEQLLESNKELESFAYSVSHDLRVPLRHILGFSEILKEESGKGKNKETQDLIGKITDSASKMGTLIDNLLNYSRLGRTSIRKNLLSLNPILEEIIREAGDLTKDRKIHWNISILPEVRADNTLIRLVLQNLINNAIKFTSKKEEAVIQIGYQGDENENVIFIKDNGAGFEMEYAGKLFGVFQRLHSMTEFEGTGIGLATVRRIIARHGGKVWAEGAPNAGATFYFTLPK
jgi:PAS domain S-box-containing protein